MINSLFAVVATIRHVQSPHSRIAALHIAAYCSGSFYRPTSRETKYGSDAVYDGEDNNNDDDNDGGSGEDEDDDEAVAKSINKYVRIVELLCAAGARVDCKDAKNLTPLHYACRTNGHV